MQKNLIQLIIPKKLAKIYQIKVLKMKEIYNYLQKK